MEFGEEFVEHAECAGAVAEIPARARHAQQRLSPFRLRVESLPAVGVGRQGLVEGGKRRSRAPLQTVAVSDLLPLERKAALLRVRRERDVYSQGDQRGGGERGNGPGQPPGARRIPPRDSPLGGEGHQAGDGHEPVARQHEDADERHDLANEQRVGGPQIPAPAPARQHPHDPERGDDAKAQQRAAQEGNLLLGKIVLISNT